MISYYRAIVVVCVAVAQVFLAVVEEARDLLENDVQAPMQVLHTLAAKKDPPHSTAVS